MSKVFDFNAQLGQLNNQLTGQAFTNTNVKIVQTEKGLCYRLISGASLSITMPSFNLIDFFVFVKGSGTLRVSIGGTNTDIVVSNTFQNIKTTVNYTAKTTITISIVGATSVIYLSRLIGFNHSLSVDELNSLSLKFDRTMPISQTKRNFTDNVDVYYINDFRFQKADGITTEIQGIDKGTGTFVVKTDTNLKNYVECRVNGDFKFQNKLAYGTWEYEFIKNNESNTILLIPICFGRALSIGSAYYYLEINASEQIRFVRYNANGSQVELFRTNISYLLNFIAYKIKIKRDDTGLFTIYIKGGNFGDTYNIVNASTGTNPILDNTITQSTYSFVTLSFTDKIYKILIKKA